MSEACIVPTEADLGLAVEALFRFAEGRKKIALTGDLGAGKTAFTKAICQRLNVRDTVSSPTFAIVNEYVFSDENGVERLLHHLDLYRLRNVDEAFDIGIEDYFYDDHYCIVEWPEIMHDFLPEDMVFVEIEVMTDGGRQFTFSNEINNGLIIS